MRNCKFNEKIVALTFEKRYNNSDSEILRQEIVAANMNKRWDIIFDKKTLNFYLGWRGKGIFKVQFREQEDELIVRRAFVEENFHAVLGIDYCSSLLHWIIEVPVLGKDAELPHFGIT